MSKKTTSANQEIEIKVRLDDHAEFERRLQALGFQLKTPETMERNVLFDTPDGRLRQRKQLLRIRHYGDQWLLTHKAQKEGNSTGRHKVRVETETRIEDGDAMAEIFGYLGYSPVFIYEKRRSEWSDGEGGIVIDITPIGEFAELEGNPEWIDATAEKLSIEHSTYISLSYGQLFMEWKKKNNSFAENMTFSEIGGDD